MKKLDLTGKKFGKWIILEKAERPITNSPSKPLYWKCKCSCGVIRTIPSHNLRCNRTLSCGHDMILPTYKALYNRLMYSNKNRISCNISFEEFLNFTKIEYCHYCHNKVTWKKINATAYNLDRKDNSKGYFKDNCVVCCYRCNFGKRNAYSYDEWYEMNKCFRDRNLVNCDDSI